MHLKILFCIILFVSTGSSKAQNRCYVFKHGQFINGTNYNCGTATIMKDESIFLNKSEYQSKKNELDVECKIMYKGNEKLYKQIPYAELVLPNEVMVVLYFEQQMEIKKGSFCSNTFYECFKGTDAAVVVNRSNSRMASVGAKTKCIVFRKIVKGENIKINN
jgi:hypothetical protein